jgi:hypothetical protein
MDGIIQIVNGSIWLICVLPVKLFTAAGAAAQTWKQRRHLRWSSAADAVQPEAYPPASPGEAFVINYQLIK